jgi:beta-lactamase regulating signal transducer with metallopeptidase domain
MIDVNWIVGAALKSLVVAGAALALLRLTRNRSAAERSLIGHLGLLALVVLPAITWLMPAWNPLPVAAAPASFPVAVPALTSFGHAAAAPAASTAAAVAAPAGFALPSVGDLAVWLYLIPAVLLILAMIVAVVRLGAMHRRANVLVNPSWQAALAMAQRRMGFKHGTALLVSEELRSPVSWGVMRPIILLNEQAVGATAEAEAIIAHELAHVARLDWAKLLIARLACALFWFNPLVWRLARECHQLREEAADDAVLLSEVDGADYASLLVNAARHDNKALLIAAHGVAPGKDSLKRRITRVLDADLARGPANNAWMALCLVVLVAVAAPLAAFDPTAKGMEHSVRNASVVLTGPEGTLRVRPDGSVLLTARDGRTLTVSHYPNGVEHLAAGAAAQPANEADRDRDDEIDRIISSKAVGLTPDYINAMRAAGFTGSVDDLTGARAVGVTPEFARQMRQYDPTVDLDTVIGAKATGMDPAYFSQMRQLFPDLSLDDAVGMSAVGVSLDFARQMRSLFPHASADDVQGMAAVGVTPDYVREMRRQGLPAGDPDEAIDSRVLFHGKKGARLSVVGPAIANSVAVSTSMANSIARSVAASLPAWMAPQTKPVPPVAPVPPAPPGGDDDDN